MKEKLGSEGFIGWLPSGECWGGAGSWYGRDTPTNNEAEASALLGALRFLAAHQTKLGASVTVKGDSDLVIAFMLRCYRPTKPSLPVLT